MVKLIIKNSLDRITYHKEIIELFNSSNYFYDSSLNKTIYLVEDIDAVTILLKYKWFSVLTDEDTSK